ncbi:MULTISPECIES: iron chelate uptake ABC transporter family permease subunit [unclassified Rothia (in: high G+C Gram-positive bacteria)]|uniref:FecCD family ABC transporter permease n=1 Tax=unclassified Rothia (in: high G+C Gram-positive bacteria) TaxID=2689056 RepID=UPI00195E4DE8|nr:MULTISPECIES: iron ABC transporter permease [unclassified Rothia (in: high G+C Gram-positive bacteria)]MBM7051535.1 iron ABC transporter permease [Rothia sp. ZJ1223]QRZ61314.1 iron ABC transporter permease [Rothia sp. ZJ932]
MASLIKEPASSVIPAARVRDIRRRAGRRPARVIAALVALLTAVFFARVLLGDYTVTPGDFLTIVQGGTLENARGARFIVMEEKLPRAVLGLLVGLAFGAAGATFQLLLRNPLASPDIIGISTGASLGAVLGIVFWAASGLTLSLFAIGFSLLVAVGVMGLAAGRTNVGNRFILMGIGVSALAGAIINYLLARMSLQSASSATLWMTGSLSVANWNRIGIVAAALALIVPVVFALHTRLHAVAVGEDLAHSLGLNVARTRWTFIVLGVLLAAVATAASGPIAFVAFVSGPIARRLIGGRHSLLASALTGAIIVIAADAIATDYIPSGPLPVGILTGALGAPALIWLLVQAQKET